MSGTANMGEQERLISVGDEQLFRREERNHLAALVGHHDLLLDAGGGVAVARGAIGLEREHHALLELEGMVERDQAADDRALVERHAEAVAELQAEGLHLVDEAELRRLAPELSPFVGGTAGPDRLAGGVDPLPPARA